MKIITVDSWLLTDEKYNYLLLMIVSTREMDFIIKMR